MRNPPRGLTLIEVMLVIAVIGILSSVALPSFRNYQLRAKQAERGTIMTAIHVAMTDMYLRDGKFPTDTGTPGESVLDLPSNPPGVASSTKRNFDLSLGDWSKMSLQLEGRVYYTYQAAAATNALGAGSRLQLVVAQGDLDSDGIRQTVSMTFVYNREGVVPGFPLITNDQPRAF